MKIFNDTRYRTADLRAIARAVVEEERSRHGNPPGTASWSWSTLKIQFSPASAGIQTWAYDRRQRSGVVRLLPDSASTRSIAATVRQISYSHRGVGVDDMSDEMLQRTAAYLARFDAIVTQVGERVAEPSRVVVLPKEVAPKIAPDRRMVALLRSRKLQAGWVAREESARRVLARARTAIKKLEREQSRLERAIAKDLE